MRLSRKQEMTQAANRGDWTRYDQVRHWAVGGYRKRHAALRRARRMAEKLGHLLKPFRSGEQMFGEETGDPDVYCAECRRCRRSVVVSFDLETKGAHITPISVECE